MVNFNFFITLSIAIKFFIPKIKDNLDDKKKIKDNLDEAKELSELAEKNLQYEDVIQMQKKGYKIISESKKQ